jgi:hypothetical protein
MTTDDLGNSLGNPGHKSRPFENAQLGIVLSIDIFELMVSVELDVPAEVG